MVRDHWAGPPGPLPPVGGPVPAAAPPRWLHEKYRPRRRGALPPPRALTKKWWGDHFFGGGTNASILRTQLSKWMRFPLCSALLSSGVSGSANARQMPCVYETHMIFIFHRGVCWGGVVFQRVPGEGRFSEGGGSFFCGKGSPLRKISSIPGNSEFPQNFHQNLNATAE